MGIPFAITPIGQPHQSPTLPVPGDQARCKRRGFSPEAAVWHSLYARVLTDLDFFLFQSARFFFEGAQGRCHSHQAHVTRT